MTGSASAFTNNAAHSGAFIVYINGLEVPCKSVSQRYGVWQIPELQLEMVADPVLTRLGFEDRVQVVVFYLDDTGVDRSVAPEFRLFGEGEITGWGYQNTPSGRSIVFTCVNQFAIFTQLFVQFLTQLDDMLGHATHPGAGTYEVATPSSQIVFPFSLFTQGLIPGTPSGQAAEGESDAAPADVVSQDPGSITRPFDFLFNCVKNMIGAQVPAEQRTVPAVNFFTRWARLTNFHNRFGALPFFDEGSDKNIFPVLKALQTTSAIDVIARNLIPQIQNAGSIYDMLQLVYQTMYMEIAMIPAMPLVTVDLKTDLVIDTAFERRTLIAGSGADDKKLVAPKPPEPTKPKRLQNYFAKPQFLFGIPPTCNVFFPSQIQMFAYDENYATQPTRLYFNDEVLHRLFKAGKSGLDETIMNALATAYPPEANAVDKQRFTSDAKVNGKNFLLFPEEFFKGPVMDRRNIPPWLFFLRQHEATTASGGAGSPNPSAPSSAAPASAAPPRIRLAPRGTMVTRARIGKFVDGRRRFSARTERLRDLAREYGRTYAVPEDFLLAWVEHESGGKISAVTSLNERGYFQIMGPHPDESGTTDGTEAGSIGLTNPQHKALSGVKFGTDGEPLAAERRVSFEAGARLAKHYRQRADALLEDSAIGDWGEADRFRAAKLLHGGSGFARRILAHAQQALGRPPRDWEEMYAAALPRCTLVEAKVLGNATGVGSVVLGATGTTVDASEQFSAGGVQVQGPRADTPLPSDLAEGVSKAGGPVVDGPEEIAADLFTKLREGNPTVYELYAEYEFFRERYSRRSGSLVLSFNPYVVPGFPMAAFDHRDTRVDIFAYVTTVQQKLSHRGGRSTQVSFTYGRTLQEMFDLLAQEFAQGAAVAGAAPREPVRDIRKVVQNFEESEEFYRRLFFGGRRLFNKDAAFDWRKVIGYRPPVTGDAPERLFMAGVSEAQRDRVAGAGEALADLQPKLAALTEQVQGLRTQAQESRATLNEIEEASIAQSPSAEVEQRQGEAHRRLLQAIAHLNPLEPQLEALTAEVEQAKAVARDPEAFSAGLVVHNLVGDRELVPLAGAEPMFHHYDSAMAYGWRPICTLDEYVIFHDAVGEGVIPADGHPRSVGARYYNRIRRLTPLTKDTKLPLGADGLATAEAATLHGTPAPADTPQPTPPSPAPGITSGTGPHGTNAPGDFPQTREDWDKILLAYRNNVTLAMSPRS